MKTKILFLEGGPGCDIYIEKICYDEDERFETFLIDDLYKQPSNLELLPKINPDVIVIQTTGLFSEYRDELIEKFKQLNYLPKTIAFYTESSLMVYLKIARELKQKGTKICFLPDVFDKQKIDKFEEINWL